MVVPHDSRRQTSILAGGGRFSARPGASDDATGVESRHEARSRPRFEPGVPLADRKRLAAAPDAGHARICWRVSSASIPVFWWTIRKGTRRTCSPICAPRTQRSIAGSTPASTNFRPIRTSSDALLNIAEVPDSRQALLLLAEILRAPGLAERLSEVLRPVRGSEQQRIRRLQILSATDRKVSRLESRLAHSAKSRSRA